MYITCICILHVYCASYTYIYIIIFPPGNELYYPIHGAELVLGDEAWRRSTGGRPVDQSSPVERAPSPAARRLSMESGFFFFFF